MDIEKYLIKLEDSDNEEGLVIAEEDIVDPKVAARNKANDSKRYYMAHRQQQQQKKRNQEKSLQFDKS